MIIILEPCDRFEQDKPANLFRMKGVTHDLINKADYIVYVDDKEVVPLKEKHRGKFREKIRSLLSNLLS